MFYRKRSRNLQLIGEKVRTKNNSVTIEGNRVTKRSTSHLMAIEVEKSKNAGIIARSTGLFRVPDVTDFNSSEGYAVFEYIPDMVSIRNVIFLNPNSSTIAERLGEILAVIHKELKLPELMSKPLIEPVKPECESVFIHGDLSLSNIGYIPQSDEIVLIDWQTTAQFNPSSTLASPYFDLAWLIRNIYLSPTRKMLFQDLITPVLQSLLGMYHKKCHVPIEPKVLYQYLEHMSKARDKDIIAMNSLPIQICQKVNKHRTWTFLAPYAGNSGDHLKFY